MKKELKAECFTNVNKLCNFVNKKKISQENIQTIIETAVYDQVCITLVLLGNNSITKIKILDGAECPVLIKMRYSNVKSVYNS